MVATKKREEYWGRDKLRQSNLTNYLFNRTVLNSSNNIWVSEAIDSNIVKDRSLELGILR